jgi:hypothetical protein
MVYVNGNNNVNNRDRKGKKNERKNGMTEGSNEGFHQLSRMKINKNDLWITPEDGIGGIVGGNDDE